MARNHTLAAKTANDNDRRVERVLQVLAYPEPLLKLCHEAIPAHRARINYFG